MVLQRVAVEWDSQPNCDDDWLTPILLGAECGAKHCNVPSGFDPDSEITVVMSYSIRSRPAVIARRMSTSSSELGHGSEGSHLVAEPFIQTISTQRLLDTKFVRMLRMRKLYNAAMISSVVFLVISMFVSPFKSLTMDVRDPANPKETLSWELNHPATYILQCALSVGVWFLLGHSMCMDLAWKCMWSLDFLMVFGGYACATAAFYADIHIEFVHSERLDQVGVWYLVAEALIGFVVGLPLGFFIGCFDSLLMHRRVKSVIIGLTSAFLAFRWFEIRLGGDTSWGSQEYCAWFRCSSLKDIYFDCLATTTTFLLKACCGYITGNDFATLRASVCWAPRLDDGAEQSCERPCVTGICDEAKAMDSQQHNNDGISDVPVVPVGTEITFGLQATEDK